MPSLSNYTNLTCYSACSIKSPLQPATLHLSLGSCRTVVCMCCCRSELTCCSQDGPYQQNERHGMFDLTESHIGLTVGRCEVITPAKDNADFTALSQNTLALPGFTLNCQLSEEADRCGPSGCGGMVLSGQGWAYELAHLVLDGGSPDTYRPAPCFNVNGRRQDSLGDDLQRRLNKTLETVGAAKKAAEKDGGARGPVVSDPRDMVFVAKQILVYSGPVTVMSKTHETKWEKGWVDYMYASAFVTMTKADLAALEMSAGGPLPRASSDDLGTFKFELFRDKEGY